MKRTYKDNILFHHAVRIGKRKKPFVVTKIRTMKRRVLSDQEKVFGEEAIFISKLTIEDPRITKLGKFLRKLQVDEVPQIINLLKGELLPVGIRPLSRIGYRRLPKDIKEMYNEMGPGLLGIFYACNPFPPSKEQTFNEYRNFYVLWKENKKKAYSIYAKKILANRIKGKAWSR